MLVAIIMAAIGVGSAAPATEYLSDIPDRLIRVEQGWGVLGYDVCAHAPSLTALGLCIVDKKFAKGLGHHAAGNIVVDLEGRYTEFDAEVGVQQQNTTEGSVIFRVYVDGKKAFESGVMRQSTPAAPIHVDVKGAQELRLEADDAGDGIICDCADWADARLTLAPGTKPSKREAFDLAPCAEVTTWDPKRMDGARAARIEEYRAEDVFLDQPVKPLPSGGYELPRNGCIGLLWFERRKPTMLTVEFKPSSAKPAVEGVQVQAWAGLYPFQGEWKPLVGALSVVGSRVSFVLQPKANQEFVGGFRKVRWVFPPQAGAQPKISKLTAEVDSRMKTESLRLEAELGGQATIRPFGCEFYGAKSVAWDMHKPLELKVKYPVGSSFEGSTSPALRFTTASGGFTVRIGDIVGGPGVYLKSLGVFLTKGKTNLAQHKVAIKGKQTVLERVRQMPDQTFAQSMTNTYRETHFGSPTLLSLGPDNWKWLVEPDGAIVWEPAPEVAEKQMPFERRRCLMGITLNGKPFGLTKEPVLPKGLKRWMPAVNLVSGLSRYTSYVAPAEGSRGLFITKIDLDGQADLVVKFVKDRNTGSPADVTVVGERAIAKEGDRVLATVELAGLDGAIVSAQNGEMHVMKNGKGSLVLAVPGWETTSLEPVNESKLFESFLGYWNKVAGEGMQIQIPDPLLSDIIQSSRVRCIVDARNQDNGARLAPWIAEIHYGPLESEANTIVRGMALMGHRSFTEKCLDYFIKLYSPAGYLTTGYTLVGTGWHLWSLGESFGLYDNKNWVKSHADEIARLCRWVVGERRKTMKLDPLGRKPIQYGLVTPGVIADWNAYQYYFYSNGTYCAGLEAAGKALKAAGHKDADSFISEAARFRKDILTSYHKAQVLTPVVPLQDGTWVLGQPSQTNCPGPLGEWFSGEDGSRAWCYDVEIGPHNLIQQGILPANGEDSKQTADHLEDDMYLRDGWGDYPASESTKDWFDLGGFSKVQPYYSRLVEVYALRDDVKPFIRSYFNMIASLVDPSNLTIWEHFDHYGAPDKTHETGVFLQQTRYMLVHERGEELWLAPMVTSNWLKDGMVVSVGLAPTRFGDVGYSITSHVKDGFIEAVINPPTRSVPKSLIIRLRHPDGLKMSSVTINGKPTKNFDPALEVVKIPASWLAGNKGQIEVHAKFGAR